MRLENCVCMVEDGSLHSHHVLDDLMWCDKMLLMQQKPTNLITHPGSFLLKFLSFLTEQRWITEMCKSKTVQREEDTDGP